MPMDTQIEHLKKFETGCVPAPETLSAEAGAIFGINGIQGQDSDTDSDYKPPRYKGWILW